MLFGESCIHYCDVMMGTMASLITSLTIVYSTVHPGADQRKHQSSASLAFLWEIHRRPVNSPHKWPVTQKMFPFDDVIMAIGNNKACVNFRCEAIRESNEVHVQTVALRGKHKTLTFFSQDPMGNQCWYWGDIYPVYMYWNYRWKSYSGFNIYIINLYRLYSTVPTIL